MSSGTSVRVLSIEDSETDVEPVPADRIAALAQKPLVPAP